jgi:hypothetical protein
MFMFAIEKDAGRYIRERAGSVVIRLMFEPGVGGGCLCSPKRVAGQYVPLISLGKPRSRENTRFTKLPVDGIDVYFPPMLQAEESCGEIRFRLGRFLFFSWLKIEGVKPLSYWDFERLTHQEELMT